MLRPLLPVHSVALRRLLQLSVFTSEKRRARSNARPFAWENRVKSKLAALALLLVCFCAQEVKADSVVEFSATGSALPGGIPIDLQALLTVESVTGTFFNPGLAVFFTGTVYEITNITGTLNGNPISFFQNPAGHASWLNLDLSLGAFYFSANGNECWLENEGDYSLIAIVTDNGAGGSAPGNGTPISYHADLVSTPEPTTLALLLLGLSSAFALLKAIR